MSSWNDSSTPRRDPLPVPPGNRPLDVPPEEYERRLWAATDASLRRDPERWVTARAGDTVHFVKPQAMVDPYLTDAAREAVDVAAAQDARNAQAEDYRRRNLKGWDTRRSRGLTRSYPGTATP